MGQSRAKIAQEQSELTN